MLCNDHREPDRHGCTYEWESRRNRPPPAVDIPWEPVKATAGKIFNDEQLNVLQAHCHATRPRACRAAQRVLQWHHDLLHACILQALHHAFVSHPQFAELVSSPAAWASVFHHHEGAHRDEISLHTFVHAVRHRLGVSPQVAPDASFRAIFQLLHHSSGDHAVAQSAALLSFVCDGVDALTATLKRRARDECRKSSANAGAFKALSRAMLAAAKLRYDSEWRSELYSSGAGVAGRSRVVDYEGFHGCVREELALGPSHSPGTAEHVVLLCFDALVPAATVTRNRRTAVSRSDSTASAVVAAPPVGPVISMADFLAFVEGSHELVDPLRLVRAAAASQEATDKLAARKKPTPPPKLVYEQVFAALADAEEPKLKAVLDGPSGGAPSAHAASRLPVGSAS